MKMLLVDIYKFIMWWHFYSNVCAVISPITLGKPSIASNCGLMLAWEFDIPAEMRIILSHSAGMARLRVDWHSPKRLASSFWNAPVARNPSHALVPTGDVHTFGHKRMAPCCCAPTPAAALRPVPGGLPSKRLMNQLSSCASKSFLSLNTRSLIALKQTLFLMVCTATLCTCF